MDPKNKKPRYEGELARPIPYREALAAALLDEKEWRTEIESDRLLLLLKHYGIEITNPNRWLALALHLARDHVPGFRISDKRGPGRPRTRQTNYIAGLLRQYGERPKQKKTGRPREWDDKRYAAMLRSVELRKEELSANKRARITDKQALRDIISDAAKQEGKSITKALADDLAYYQKRLSEARRKIPKTQEN